MISALILGCGPAGLLAAHACHLEKVGFAIASRKRKSQLYGSQYLHKAIPDLVSELEGQPVKYEVRGTPEEYRRKVHGKWWDGHVAPEEFEADHMAWNIREAYDRLWIKYSKRIYDYSIPTNEEMAEGKDRIAKITYDLGLDPSEPYPFDLIISTVPRSLWALPGEEFIYSEGWAIGDAPEEGQFVPYPCSDNTIVCDGTSEVSWTRLSKVFGYTTVEWPHHAPRPPLRGVVPVVKPLHYRPASQAVNPTANWLHVGRYGEWKKGVVVTDAFDRVTEAIRELKE